MYQNTSKPAHLPSVAGFFLPNAVPMGADTFEPVDTAWPGDTAANRTPNAVINRLLRDVNSRVYNRTAYMPARVAMI